MRIGSSDPFFYSAKDGRGGATLGWIQSTTTWQVRAATIHQPDLVINGTVAPGQSFSFTVRNTDRADAGDVALVVLSATGIGNQTGGIPLFDGKVLDLDFDAVTSLGLAVPLAFLTGTMVPVVGGLGLAEPLGGPSPGDPEGSSLRSKDC